MNAFDAYIHKINKIKECMKFRVKISTAAPSDPLIYESEASKALSKRNQKISFKSIQTFKKSAATNTRTVELYV